LNGFTIASIFFISGLHYTLAGFAHEHARPMPAIL
jgi:hypothetical protein